MGIFVFFIHHFDIQVWHLSEKSKNLFSASRRFSFYSVEPAFNNEKFKTHLLLISIALMIYNNAFVNEETGRIAFKDFYREEQMQKVYELFLRNFYALHLDKKTYRVHAPKIKWKIDNDAYAGAQATPFF